MGDMNGSLGFAVTSVTGSAAEDVRDFGEFFDAERQRLYAALCIVTRNRHEAEELTQDAFVSLWERWERIGTLSDPVGYLYRTAMNAFRSRTRRAALAMKRTLRVTPRDDGIASVEANDAVLRALSLLPTRQRAAVVLTDLLGYSSEEAARMLGVRASTIRTHASRAHSALKHTMGEDR
jgi:RNA polymerase sigma-70 factor, ECF subfamily